MTAAHVCLTLASEESALTESHQYSQRVRPVSIRRLAPTPSSHHHDAEHVCGHAQKMCLKSPLQDKWRNRNMMKAVKEARRPNGG
ncbi:Hypothetical predicted protein [Xyrichtys novacula]|uniref:Uncharacterized protein n=1 Tax=Xyrichtys novacula TaxID=13765 RepID=A0AAV1F1T0_XYRNO|nr:Hypothetical predicted protein [Xyrichtys novacula]